MGVNRSAPNLEECENPFHAFNLFAEAPVYILTVKANLYSPADLSHLWLEPVEFWALFQTHQASFFFNSLHQLAHSPCRVHMHMCLPDLKLLQSSQLTSKHSSFLELFLNALCQKFLQACMQARWRGWRRFKKESNFGSKLWKWPIKWNSYKISDYVFSTLLQLFKRTWHLSPVHHFRCSSSSKLFLTSLAVWLRRVQSDPVRSLLLSSNGNRFHCIVMIRDTSLEWSPLSAW